ncbi:Uncharacterized protein LOCC1_G004901 [Lachnellula occidentalis]|uniref:Cupin type-1 domain-containing protein n=1 Tax=Lachnellula occidentalis TaxID=215460 RepID=A0A8H8RXS2_9HELO|nr:Uncharacterized protein LOCC1_G004901 [Lachnellula occidentalis]
MAVQPEIYYLQQTRFVPNNRLPVLIYRNVLPQPHTEISAQEMLGKNHWTNKGTWGAVPRHHFHPNTHECYGVLQGHSTLLIGRGPLDNDEERSVCSVSTELKPGDVIILPAGVADCSIDNDADYSYTGLYPEVSNCSLS